MKIVKNLVVATLTCTVFLSTTLTGYASELVSENRVAVSTFSTVEIQPRADIIEWRYQFINGVLSKRQYNVTKNKWIGNWMPA